MPESLPQKPPKSPKFSLTSREWEITCFLMQGYSRSSIAEKLCISVNTLKKHISNIYRKMNVSSTRQFFAELGRAEKGSFLDENLRRGGGDSYSFAVCDRCRQCRRIVKFAERVRHSVFFGSEWVRIGPIFFGSASPVILHCAIEANASTALWGY